MKKIIASILALFFVLLSPLFAFASTTESMMMFSTGFGSDEYAVMPLEIYDESDALINFNVSVVDKPLANTIGRPSNNNQSIIIPLNVRFSSNAGTRRWFDFTYDNSFSERQLRYEMQIRMNDGNNLFYTLLGLQSTIHGLSFPIQRYLNGTQDGTLYLYKSDFVSAQYRLYDDSDTFLSSGNINSNDVVPFVTDNRYFSVNIDVPKTVSDKAVEYMSVIFYFDLPSNLSNYTSFNSGFGFYISDCYFSGDFTGGSSSSSSSQNDYNKNVEAELGNIQVGINNVINSVVQMGNQAWQGAQQTVQAVTQMTQQLSTAIEQQRQDILNGLGLLGDDIGSSLSNVKSEITNIGSSITNKIESTTETITNTIENKVDEVTTAVEDVKQSVTEVKQSILDLPNKIKDMLLGLIVPDSDTMADKYSEFSGLLEEKLGVIYQIPMMLFDFFDTIVNAATTPQTTLTLPAFQLPWIDGTTLTVWQPMEYRIIPEGMQVLSDLIKTITSMTVVVLTFNSVKRAYERFLRS